MKSCLLRIVKRDVTCRSLKCEILKGKKKLPFKYLYPYKTDPVVVQAYKDYLFERELDKFYFGSVRQISMEDLI